jgi:glycogen debranching enzyme
LIQVGNFLQDIMRRFLTSQQRRFAIKLLGIGLVVAIVYEMRLIAIYLRRVLRQPRLIDPRIIAKADTSEKIQECGYRIALANLQGGIETRHLADGREFSVLCAGIRNFREPWARDFGFASYGLLAAGQLDTAREGLELFFHLQRDTGQFPVKIHSTSIVDRYIHSLFDREQPIYNPIKPKYITAHNTISLDGNCLIVISAMRHATHTGDDSILEKNWQGLKQAIDWLNGHAAEDGLLQQSAFTDWADSVGRTGRILYTNVLYWKALHELALAAKRLGYTDDHAFYSAKAQGIHDSVQDHFWRPDLGFFVTGEDYEILSSSGNTLAVAWGLANEEQSQIILDSMAEFKMADPVPTQVTHIPYPIGLIAIENRLGGIASYHTQAAWLWLGAWHIIALARSGRIDEAEELLQRAATAIVRDGVVHEVYGQDGSPLSTLWYTSEAPLTWNAGMLVYAYHVVYEAKNESEKLATLGQDC